MVLFKMGGKDYTPFIQMGTYKVNHQDVTEEWTDGNYVIHRPVVRERLSGTFTIWFDDPEEYYEFLRTAKRLKTTGGYTPVVLFSNNHLNENEVNAYITIDPINLVPYFGIKEHDGFEVTVEER